MYPESKQDRAVYYWLKELFADSSFVNIVDEFPVGELKLPTISTEGGNVGAIPLEMGNRSPMVIRIYTIDIFAKNKNQRDEFSYRIFHELEDNIPVYNYDEGFPPLVSPTRIGCLIIEPSSVEAKKETVIPELVDTLYWRSSVSFQAVYSQST